MNDKPFFSGREGWGDKNFSLVKFYTRDVTYSRLQKENTNFLKIKASPTSSAVKGIKE